MRRIAVIGGLTVLTAAGVFTYLALLGTTYHAGAGFEAMSAINAKIKPGDLCVVHPGVQDAMPNPAAASSTGDKITYVGSAGLTDTLARASIVCPGGVFGKPNVTLKGLTFSSKLELTESADYDSVLYCTVKGNFSSQGADHVVFANSKWTGNSFCLNKWVLGHSDDVKILNCDFPYLGQGQTSGDHAVLYWDVDGLVEMFNRKLVTVEAGTTGDAGEGPVWYFDTRNVTSRGNTTSINLKKNCYGVWRLRGDSGTNKGCFNWHMDGDRIICYGQGGRLLASSSASCGSGNYLAQCVGSWDVFMDSCVVDASACVTSQFEFQGGMHSWHITNSVIAMNGPALYAFDIHGSTTQAPTGTGPCNVTNCTLVGVNVVRFTDEYSRPTWEPGAMTFKNNIVYAWSGAVASFASSLAAAPAGFVSSTILAYPTLPAQFGSGSIAADPLFVNPTKGSLDAHVKAGSPALAMNAGAYGAPGPSPTPSPTPTPSPSSTPSPSPSVPPGDTTRITVTGPAVITVTQ